MGTHATLYKLTAHDFTPETIQQLSTEMGLPLERTQAAFNVVMPSLLMAFTQHGPTVLTLLKKNSNGQELVKNLFGNELTNFSTKLELPADLPLPSVIRMLELIAPRMARVLSENVGGEDLKTKLMQETAALAESVPTDISNHFNYGTANTKMGGVSRFVEGTFKDLTPYPKE